MKLSALKQRARKLGVGEGQLDAADDAADTKQAVIDLILAVQDKEL